MKNIRFKKILTGVVCCMMAFAVAGLAFAFGGCADNRKLIGFDTEMAEKFAADNGLTIKFRLIKWEAKEQELASGRSDLVWNGLTYDTDRAANMELSNYYMKNRQVAVVRDEDSAMYTSIQSIIDSNAKLSAETGSGGEHILNAFPDSCPKKKADSQRSAMLDVKTKNVDIAFVDATMAEYLCNATGSVFSSLKVVSDLALVVDKYDVFVPNADINDATEHYSVAAKKGNTGVIAMVNDFFVSMSASGNMRLIAEKYGLDNVLEDAYVNEKTYDSLTEAEKADWLAIKKRGKLVVAYTLNAPIAMYEEI